MTWLLIAGSLIHFFVGELVYVRNTLLGRSQPNRITFFLWALIAGIAFAASIATEWSWAFLPIFMVGFGPLLIFLASFFNPKAYWKLGIFDYFCGFLAILAIILWVLTKEPAVALFFAILADGFAALPTLVKAWKHPETETSVAYITSTLNVSIGIIALTIYDFAHLGFLLYSLFINGMIAIIILRKNPLKRLRSDFVHSFEPKP